MNQIFVKWNRADQLSPQTSEYYTAITQADCHHKGNLHRRNKSIILHIHARARVYTWIHKHRPVVCINSPDPVSLLQIDNLLYGLLFVEYITHYDLIDFKRIPFVYVEVYLWLDYYLSTNVYYFQSDCRECAYTVDLSSLQTTEQKWYISFS